MYDAERLKENPTGTTTDESGVEQLQILRDKYEGKLTTSLYTGTLFVASVASILALGAICLTSSEDLSRIVLPISTLSVMLVSSLTLLVVSQLPSTLTSARTRFLVGQLSSVILGFGILILGGAIPMFACILSITAALPRIKRLRPTIGPFILAIMHVGQRFILEKELVDNKISQIISETILMFTAILAGLYYRILTATAHQRTFAGTRTVIESRIKLECEREQQEQLLLSVIPAYIAAEVKRSIMLKMADACQEANKHKQTRFHEMYVQRHNNVSILYADIVNFTPLSEQLSASDLVKTLNELFGRFDQIAQVNII
ncbi:hypothetical protein HZH66_012885 [Vespula vulgaris]|uniref:adenylate cyclase n=1 Tax=Vespula vulgaris TaxID=7454 RepID=A0A834MSF1_VESVU|nr:hypothetical protein HZH66_012885 [Vespula vulgaris]